MIDDRTVIEPKTSTGATADKARRGRSPERVALWIICAVLFPLATVYSWLVYAPCDDAYIFLVYARNFLEGNGLTYNGAQVEGFTSASWMALLIGLGLTRMPLPAVAVAASTASGLVALWATYRLARATNLSPRRALIAPLLLVAGGDAAFYMGSGLEQMLFTALVALCLAQSTFGEPAALLQSARFPVALAALIATRPDGALVAAFLLLQLAWSGRSRSPAIRCGVVLSVLMAPLLLARFGYYGDWLPNTYYAKGSAWFANLSAGESYVRSALLGRYGWAFYPTAVLFVVACLRRRTDLIATVLPLLLLGALWTGYVVAIGGDNMVGARMLLPVLPLLFVVLARLSSMIPFRFAGPGVLLLAFLLINAFRSDPKVVGHIAGWRRDGQVRRGAGLYLRDHFAPDTLVALNPAGIIPYYSRLPTIDMLGLNDAHIARRGRRDSSLAGGHQVGDGAYVLSRRPDVILFGGSLAPSPSNLVSDREIWATPEFHRNYELQQWPVGSAYVRRPDGPRALDRHS